MSTKTIIDLSSENGKINWSNVSLPDGVILRCHQKFGIDTEFENNFKFCKDNHVPVGVYKYSYATTVAKARVEAKNVLSVLKGRRLEYPVFLDLEDETLSALGKEKIDSIAKAFLKQIIKAGYGVGIYCNKYWYDTFVSDSLKSHFQFWIASYPDDDNGSVQERLKPNNVWGWQYTKTGKVNGISGVVDKSLFFFDDEKKSNEIQNETKNPTAEDALNVIRGWLGLRSSDGSHKKIVDIYNSYSPLAQGYRLSYTDSWCDATISAIFITLGATDMIGGTECGVERHIQLFKKKGIWIEDGTITPKAGDIICYNWDDTTQPNDGFADHIGIVETCINGIITTIEGNASGMVRRCQVNVGDGCIRGFARPAYSETKNDAISGKCRVLFVGKIKSKADVKTWAGDNYSNIISYPTLNKGNLVDVMDYTQYDEYGAAWYFVRINGETFEVFGFVKSSLVAKS